MSEPLDEPLGSAAEEAAKLFGAVAEWAREHGGAMAHDLDEHVATDAEECRWCPVCRAIRVYRAATPEVRDHLATAATSLAQAAAAMMATSPPQSRRSGVEHIDLTDDDWPDDGPRGDES